MQHIQQNTASVFILYYQLLVLQSIISPIFCVLSHTPAREPQMHYLPFPKAGCPNESFHQSLRRTMPGQTDRKTEMINM